MATYLHFTLTGFSKTVKSRGHKTTGIWVNYPEGSVGGYLLTLYINWIFKNLQKPDTKPQAFRWITQRALWVATYLHFILTGFSKKKKIGHTSTDILVNYPEAFLGGYLPTFYIT